MKRANFQLAVLTGFALFLFSATGVAAASIAAPARATRPALAGHIAGHTGPAISARHNAAPKVAVAAAARGGAWNNAAPKVAVAAAARGGAWSAAAAST